MFKDNLVKEKIFSIIKENIEECENVDLEGTFEEFGIGSISFIKIMVEIELYYDIEIEDRYFVSMEYDNIGIFIDKIASYIQGNDSVNVS